MDFQEPLLDAIVKGDEDAVLALLRMGACLNHGDADGLTALHWASGSADAENLVPVLIGNGANINIIDNFGKKPLHVYCQHGRANAVGKQSKAPLQIYRIHINAQPLSHSLQSMHPSPWRRSK